MKTCREIDPLVTPFVDGEAGDADRQAVREHLDACPPCRNDAAAQDSARQVLRSRAASLDAKASPELKARCRNLTAPEEARPARPFLLPRRLSWPLAVAATLLLAVAGALTWGVVHPVEAVAAQLALDHVKCFALFDQPEALHAADVRAALHDRYGWEVALPDDARAGGLRLVGGRRCVYLDGAVAHILYKRGDEPVSLFVLPPDANVPDGDVTVLGYSAVAFRRSGRTYVVLAHRPRADVSTMAQLFK